MANQRAETQTPIPIKLAAAHAAAMNSAINSWTSRPVRRLCAEIFCSPFNPKFQHNPSPWNSWLLRTLTDQEAFLRQAVDSGRFHPAEDARSIRRFPGWQVALKGSVGVLSSGRLFAAGVAQW
jgi:hypothetical protein